MKPAERSELLSIIVPTLNEVENIEPLVRDLVASAPAPFEIVFVDDMSTDGTRERIASRQSAMPIRLITRDSPTLGLSGAVIAGAREARGELLVVMDADLSHPPDRIPDLLRPILEGSADMVVGSRYVAGGSTPGWPIWRKVMSRAAAGLAYPLTGVHDSMGGFFAVRRTRLLELTPRATGFKIAFEAIVHGGKELRVVEIPIAFSDRTAGASKMNFRIALIFLFRWLAAVLRLASGKNRAGN